MLESCVLRGDVSGTLFRFLGYISFLRTKQMLVRHCHLCYTSFISVGKIKQVAVMFVSIFIILP